MRALVVWCPDWPVVAACREAGIDAGEAIAVTGADGRVAGCSPAARRSGVAAGMRRRDAEAACPSLRVIGDDEARDAVWFEPAVAAVEELAAGVEVLSPGWCAVAAKGPAGWFGAEEAAAEAIVDHLAASCDAEARVGVADGIFAAAVAALTGEIVPRGESTRFLADMDVGVLGRGRDEMTGMLRRLGVTTVGMFAALPAAAVGERFGLQGVLAHALARGRDERGLASRVVPPDLEAGAEFADEPISRTDSAAFAARGLAEALRERLSGHGLACTRLRIEAETASGRVLSRTWRADRVLRADDVARRTRWQLEGWLVVNPPAGEAAGIVRLRLVPEGIVEVGSLQDGLDDGGRDAAATDRAAVRVQGLLGPQAALHGVVQGGRAPGERVRLAEWGETAAPARPADQPWPGALPGPHPTILYPEPPSVQVRDASGATVVVSGRAEASAAPATVAFEDGTVATVAGWASPMTFDERWWDGPAARRGARMQLLTDDDQALLVACLDSVWRLEGRYD
ncbi:MAG: DNA polymerase Y family protein [Stackebrandtia sp.]